MTDPFDVMRRSSGSSLPDERFRVALLARLEWELSTDRHSADDGAPRQLEVVERPNGDPDRRRGVLMLLGLVAVAVVLMVLLAIRNPTLDDSPNDTVPVLSSSTSAGPPTTSTLTDEAIAAAGLLLPGELGGGYFDDPADATWSFAADGGPGSSDPACAPFLGTVFESPNRPARVAGQGYLSVGAGMEMYVVVFPDEAAAGSMMDSVADPSFPDCLAAVVSEAYDSLDPPAITERTHLSPVPARPLTEVGDEMVVWAMSGTYVVGGTTYLDEGLMPFVRVGRAVFWLNPNSAPTPAGTDGYPDSLLERAIATAAGRLAAAQGA